MQELYDLFDRLKNDIDNARDIFIRKGVSGDIEVIFEEMCFCLLTPQSKARMAEKVMRELTCNRVLYNLDLSDEAFTEPFRYVRFKNNKARYVVRLREMVFYEGYPLLSMLEENPADIRKKLVHDIKGFGWKEASHFLRNIGKGDDLAILDRHILKNLCYYKIISEIPKTMNGTLYQEIESQMRLFSVKTGIPLFYLDFIFWFKEANEIFK